MIARIGIPGSVHHAWQRFNSRREALAWIDRAYDRTMAANPAIGWLESGILSERKAARIRYQDGTRVYGETYDPTPEEEAAERKAFEAARRAYLQRADAVPVDARLDSAVPGAHGW